MQSDAGQIDVGQTDAEQKYRSNKVDDAKVKPKTTREKNDAFRDIGDPKSWFITEVEVLEENLEVSLLVKKVEGSPFKNNFSVDCDGDGKWDIVDADGDVTCRYEFAADYTISINKTINNPVKIDFVSMFAHYAYLLSVCG